MAKTLTTTPIELVQVTIFAVITYYMFGFQATAAKFLIYWVTLVVFALCSETIGYMAAIVTPDSKVGVAVLSIFLLLLLAFSGYLVSRAQLARQTWGQGTCFNTASAAAGVSQALELHIYIMYLGVREQ
jgi:ABC-type multidrug transport system permease subunit